MKAARSTHRRLNVILPEDTVGLLERAVPRSPYGNRSRFIDVAIRHFVRSIWKARMRRLLEEEATAHRDEDLHLAEEWFAVDAETWPGDRTK